MLLLHSRRLIALAFIAALSPANLWAEDTGIWRDKAAAVVPPGYVAGQVYRVDHASLTGYLAVFPRGSDTIETPGSAFDPGFVVTAKLRQDGEKLVFVSGTFGPRAASDRSDDPNEDYNITLRADLVGRAGSLPEGTVPCQIYAWSADKEPGGLRVRAKPSDDAETVGTLPPPLIDPAREAVPEEGLHTEFTVIGYRSGWFLIDNVQDPAVVYGEASEEQKTPSSVRGWVKTSEVMAAYANTEMPSGWLLQAPNIDAKAYPRNGSAPDERLSIDGTLKTLLACSANWALTENTDGQRGWWRGICSNQVTNCS